MKQKIPNKIKGIFLITVMFFLLLPMIQEEFDLMVENPLHGAIEVIEEPSFNLPDWFNEKYQKSVEQYLNQNFGFRNLFVRLNNQIAYFSFKKTKASGVIVGEENYLYEENYIKAYLGIDYIGQEKIQGNVFKLEKVRDTLKKLNKDILVVLAPGKGTYLPEFIPDKLLKQKKNITNYQSYVIEFRKKNILYLDFNKWFVEMKPTTPYPLYGKCGIHWSKYGDFLAGDSLIKYIGALRNVNIPKLILDSIVIKDLNENGDYDIGEGMNLLFDIPTFPMAYPCFHVQKSSSNKQSKVLVVADSYYWGLFNAGYSKYIFGNGQFWFYNQQIYPDSYDHPLNVSDINIREQVEKNDVIVLLSTDANLYKFPFGFIDQLYNSYFVKKTLPKIVDKEKRIQFYINAIKGTPNWIETITKNAKKDNISLDKAIRDNAEYMVWKEGQ